MRFSKRRMVSTPIFLSWEDTDIADCASSSSAVLPDAFWTAWICRFWCFTKAAECRLRHAPLDSAASNDRLRRRSDYDFDPAGDLRGVAESREFKYTITSSISST